jgi:signal transduction histidine kinase
VSEAVRARRAWIIDAAGAVLFTLAVMLITHRIQDADDDFRTLDLLGNACIAVAGLSLAWRRRLPDLVLGVSSGAMLLYTIRHYSGGPVYLAPIVAMYTLATLTPRRHWLIGVVLAAGVLSVAGAVQASGTGTTFFHLVYFTWGLAAGFVGDSARSRREYQESLEARARSLEESREEEARRRVAEERLRIARELHDVVAHSLASINIQASAGAHVGAAHPDQAVDALLAVKAASKEALDELRVTLGMLRAPDDQTAPRAPLPSLERLGGLIARTREAGLPIELAVSGSAALPAAVDAAAYRIVQESLTNALRHAGPAARARVSITYTPDALEIEVADDGLGSTAYSDHPGHGIAGMRERAAGLGGTLEAGAVRGGGFVVKAVLPVRVEVRS